MPLLNLIDHIFYGLFSTSLSFAYFGSNDSPKFRRSSSIHAHSARLLLDRDKKQDAIQEIKKLSTLTMESRTFNQISTDVLFLGQIGQKFGITITIPSTQHS